jgi:hypothetical protein
MISSGKTPIPFRTGMLSCNSCHGVTPCHEYPYDDLLGLYHDYRSETYDRDRISVEPSYKQIARQVGKHPKEITNRNTAVEGFFRKNQQYFRGGAMIDYGGNDGRFIPPFAYERFERIDVIDASKVSLHTSVDTQKVRCIADPQAAAYSFLTCMHVLEHVGNPKAFVQQAAQLLEPGGLMYIEVPVDLTQAMRNDLAQRVVDTTITIHEHINTFDRTSIRTLLSSTGTLTLLDDLEEPIDFGWVTAPIGRFLARKSA